jgi:uncharacterized heparinase superfamily protein
VAGAAGVILQRVGERIALLVAALWAAFRNQARRIWRGSPPHLWGLARPAAIGFAAAPKDPRPTRSRTGADLLAGAFVLGDETMRLAAGADPWNQPSPSRAFAERLHRFDWLRDLLAAGDDGAREGLRLCLEWRRVFGRWNPFAWEAGILERRVFNLACAGRAMAGVASEAETASLANLLARQARDLLWLASDEARRAERLAAVAVAGAALAGEPGQRLMRGALARLDPYLGRIVLPDGGHATRSPQAGLELLFDLLTLDESLSQRGYPPPESLSRAIDRLSAGLRFFTLADGRLASFQGGESGAPERVRAGRAHEDAAGAAGPAPLDAPHAGYQRLDGKTLQVIADAGAPARGALSLAACGQPLAIEVVCGRDRLITGCGWSPEALGPQGLRLAAGASTASVGDGVAGAPLQGFLGRALGPRLRGGATTARARRREAQEGVWVEMEHDGWVARYGLIHERRLYLDHAHGELRGEDRFTPAGHANARLTPIDVRFHLHPDAEASLARDQRSVLLRGVSNVGWWLRNDAAEVSIEPSVHFEDGRPRRSSQVVLRGRLRADRGGRVRWKLAPVELVSA